MPAEPFYDYCSRCAQVVPIHIVDRADGIAYICRLCRQQVDFDSADDTFDQSRWDRYGRYDYKHRLD